MILEDDVAVAIEAKFTEPRYESIETWLAAARSTNRGEVLEGWIRAIEAGSGATVEREVVRELPYQLIHRTASVCCVSRRKRVVVYQVFGDSSGPYYAEDLRQLAAAMPDGNGVSFYVVASAFQPTTTYALLAARWDAGERDMGADVRDALVAGPLLEFAEPVAIPI
jgi:hypothetical protein